MIQKCIDLLQLFTHVFQDCFFCGPILDERAVSGPWAGVAKGMWGRGWPGCLRTEHTCPQNNDLHSQATGAPSTPSSAVLGGPARRYKQGPQDRAHRKPPSRCSFRATCIPLTVIDTSGKMLSGFGRCGSGVHSGPSAGSPHMRHATRCCVRERHPYLLGSTGGRGV